jgi:hypothetical protein
MTTDTATIRAIVQQELRSGPLALLVRQLQGLVIPGEGSPESAVRAPVGALFIRRDGAPGTLLYQKQTGDNTDTGWVAIA